MYLQNMTDAELVAYAYQQEDPLITSDLEREMRKRLESSVDIGADKMMDILADHDITTLDDLEDFFGRIDAIKTKLDEL